MSERLLHVYGQYSKHDEVYIVGNKEALTKLRDSLNSALSKKFDEEGVELHAIEFMTGDGEGYEMHIIRNDTAWTGWSKLGLPYTGINYEDSRPNVIWPWEDKPYGL